MWTVPPLQKAETELQLVGPVSRRHHGDGSTWVFQSARGCSAEDKGAAGPWKTPEKRAQLLIGTIRADQYLNRKMR